MTWSKITHLHGPQTSYLRTPIQHWAAFTTTDSPHLAFISEFTTDIRYIEGQANRVANALSRNVHVIEQSPIDFEALAVTQSNNEELQRLRASTTSLRLEHVPIHASKHTLLCDTSQGSPRPLIPSIMRRNISNSLHSLSHPGVKAPRHLVAGRYVWPNMKRDIANWTPDLSRLPTIQDSATC